MGRIADLPIADGNCSMGQLWDREIVGMGRLSDWDGRMGIAGWWDWIGRMVN